MRAALSRMGVRCALACLVALGGAVPASAATTTTLAGYSRETPISAYRDAAVWSAYDDATERYTLTFMHGDTIRALPLPSREDEFDATVGRGAGGRVLVAYAGCPTGGRCGVYGFDPERNVSRLLHASTRRGVLPESPSLWGNRVVWVESRGERERPAAGRARGEDRPPGSRSSGARCTGRASAAATRAPASPTAIAMATSRTRGCRDGWPVSRWRRRARTGSRTSRAPAMPLKPARNVRSSTRRCGSSPAAILVMALDGTRGA